MRLALLTALLLLAHLSLAIVYRTRLEGQLTMATGETFRYVLDVVDSSGVITGSSFTYDEPNTTKTTVRGYIDKKAGVLQFKETDIVSSHDVKTKAFMCLLNARLLRKNGMLGGSVTGSESDNTACTPGTLTFSDAGQVAGLFASHDEFDVAVSMGGPKQPRAVAAVQPQHQETASNEQEKITAGVQKSYDWYTDSVVIEVWDGGTNDGDMITLKFDGKVYLNSVMLFKKHNRVAIPLVGKGTHVLEVVAESEGSEPPNTATMQLRDGNTRYNIVAYNTRGGVSKVNIKRAGG